MTGRAWTQFIFILLGLVFEVAGKGYGHFNAFPLDPEYNESIRGYIYYNCEHLKMVMIIAMLWKWPARAIDFKTDGAFLAIAVIDWLDYLASGNKIYWSIGQNPMFPISFNMVSVIFFAIYANRQWKTNLYGE